MDADQRRIDREPGAIAPHDAPGRFNLLCNGRVPDVCPRWIKCIGCTGAHIRQKRFLGDRHASEIGRRYEYDRQHQCDHKSVSDFFSRNPGQQAVSHDCNEADRRDVQQEMNMMHQDQTDTARRDGDRVHRTDGDQQRDERQKAAIDVEIFDCIHEVLEEERRSDHEDEQGKCLCAQSKYFSKSGDEHDQGGNPRGTSDRVDVPNRNAIGEPGYDRPDEGTLGEAEVISHQQMDVPDLRCRIKQLVEKQRWHDREIDRQHPSPDAIRLLELEFQLHGCHAPACGSVIPESRHLSQHAPPWSRP